MGESLTIFTHFHPPLNGRLFPVKKMKLRKVTTPCSVHVTLPGPVMNGGLG